MDITPTPFSDITLASFKGVLLDLDNTLYAHDICHKAAIKSSWTYLDKHLSVSFSWKDYDHFYQHGRRAVQDRLLPQGVCRSRLLYFQSMLEAMDIPKAYVHALNLEEVYVTSFLNTMRLDQDALTFMERCHREKVAICIISNLNTQFQIKKLQRLEVEHLTSYLVTSEEAGVEKPHPTIFSLALEKLKMSSHEVIMVGDNINFDIIGAQEYGIKAELVRIV
jgi:putative hydrolase of the HAD superfamily